MRGSGHDDDRSASAKTPGRTVALAMRLAGLIVVLVAVGAAGCSSDGSDSVTVGTDEPDPMSEPSTTAPSTGVREVHGIVTENFTDCVSHVVLTEDGAVVDGGPVLCDHGSYLVVDGIKILTSTGNVVTGAFDRHPRDLEVGTSVTVTAFPTETDPTVLTLDCEDCGVAIDG